MKPAPALLIKPALCLFLACFWSGCDRTPKGETGTTPPPGGGTPTATSPGAPAAPAPAVAANPLIVNASRFGIAGRMPKNTEIFIGSANFKKHREALEKTEYWKTLNAFIQDNRPADDKKKAKALSDLQEIKVDDFFVAWGQGSAPALRWAVDLNRIYSEYTYRTLVTGFTAGAGKNSATDPQTILANAASSPALIAEVCGLLERVELLPLVLGVKTDNPEKILNDLVSTDSPPDWMAPLTKGKLTTAAGGKFTTYQGHFGIWLTGQVQNEWVAGVEKSIQDPTLIARLKAALVKIAAKKFIFALGTADGYAVLAGGGDLRHLEFANTPADSILSLPELNYAASKVDQDLLGLFHADAAVLTAAQNEQPLTPALRGALAGLSASPVFSALAKQIEPKLEALAVTEKAYFKRTFTTASAVLWWENGLHMDASGGISPEKTLLNEPLKFGALLDTPGALVTAVGHSPTSTVGRAYFESWMDLLYTSVGGFVQAGLGGDQALGIYALVDKGAIPSLKEMYSASKTLYQKSLGTESAVVVDLHGQVPMLPGVSPADGTPPGAWLPRIAAVNDLVDRPVLAQSWQTMESSLNRGLKTVPIPMANLVPISSDKNGVTTWFYPLPMGGNDFLPCASVNDKIFILGSSKNLNETLAGRLAQQPAPALTGTHYRVSFSALRAFLKDLNSASLPGVKTEKASTALPWLAPFQVLRGRTWQEAGVLRNSLDWEIKDTQKYD
jgi:hypothetical protein